MTIVFPPVSCSATVCLHYQGKTVLRHFDHALLPVRTNSAGLVILGSFVVPSAASLSTPFAYPSNLGYSDQPYAIVVKPVSSPPSQVVNNVSSSLRYSPQSACLKTTTPVGSTRLASPVLLAVTPNPSGVSFML